MPSVAQTAEIDTLPRGARALTHDLPRDQALGLRLVALAQAAASLHMSEAAKSVDLESSQAARLIREARR